MHPDQRQLPKSGCNLLLGDDCFGFPYRGTVKRLCARPGSVVTVDFVVGGQCPLAVNRLALNVTRSVEDRIRKRSPDLCRRTTMTAARYGAIKGASERPSVFKTVQLIVGLNQVDGIGTKCLGQFIERDHSWVPPAAFEAAKVLLTETGALFNLFLGQALLPTQAGEIPTD